MGNNQLNSFKVVTKCCKQQFENDQELNLSYPYSKQKYIIQIDYRKFQQQTWFRFHKNLFFDPKKFIFLYHNYDSEQRSLIKHWKNINMKNAEFGRIGNPDDVRSQRWKYAIRRGVPIIYYKSIISVVFNRNFEILSLKSTYERLLVENKIDKQISKNVPLFGVRCQNIRQALYAPYINSQGYRALSNILRLIQKTKGGRLTYNPSIIHLIALLLIFFSQQQTYDLICIMIDDSANTNDRWIESLRWHFIFKQEQLEKLAQSFYSFIGSKSGTVKKLTKHFDSFKIDKIKIFKNIYQDFFYGVFPFKVILRIFILFLNQGVKFLFRLFYSLFKGSEIMLMQCQTTDKCMIVIRKRWIACQNVEYDQLLKNAYNIVLQKYANTKIEESWNQNKQKIVYYIPYIRNESQILTFDDLQTIWDYLPVQLQHYDVQKIFPQKQYDETNQDRKFKEMIETSEQKDLTILIIKTMNQAVFGAFFARGILKGKDGIMGHSQNFIFQLTPTKIKYSSTGSNVFYLNVKNQCLQIGGGGSGPSIRLKDNLQSGQSFKSDTYRNQPLHDGKTADFKIKQIQIFQLY